MAGNKGELHLGLEGVGVGWGKKVEGGERQKHCWELHRIGSATSAESGKKGGGERQRCSSVPIL